jgi:hypothetical protein
MGITRHYTLEVRGFAYPVFPSLIQFPLAYPVYPFFPFFYPVSRLSSFTTYPVCLGAYPVCLGAYPVTLWRLSSYPVALIQFALALIQFALALIQSDMFAEIYIYISIFYWGEFYMVFPNFSKPETVVP